MKMKPPRSLQLAIAMLLLTPTAWPQEAATTTREISVDIQAQPIGDALNELARQTGVQILFYSDAVEGLRTPRLAGSFTPRAALTRLLAGTSLRFEFIGDKTVAVRSTKPAVLPAAQRTSLQQEAAQTGVVAATEPTPAAAVNATDAPVGAPKAQQVEELIVTGTRVPGQRFIAPSPVSVLGSADIREQGAVNLESVIRDIPSASPGRSATTNNGGNGNTTLNLRNLGEARTLTLVDGKRMVPADFSGIPDINSIPTRMIERVEVVTGGASAVYGSDAIAGVANFILRKDFEGIEADAQYAAYNGDGPTVDASLIAGLNLPGRGNITAYIGYTQRDPLYAHERDWAAPALWTVGGQLVPYFSSVTPGGREHLRGMVFSPNRELVPDDGRGYDLAATQFLVVPQERYLLGTIGRFEISPAVEPYFRLMFSQNKVDRQLPPPGFRDFVEVNYGNPLLSAQERGVLFGPGPHADDETSLLYLSRRLVEEENIQELNNYQTFQMVTGVRGDIGAGFSYDVSAQYGSTSWTQRVRGDISPSRFRQGLLVNPDGTCTDPTGNCVPIDIFTSAPGAISAEQVNFFALREQASSDTTQFVATGSISGDLQALGWISPWAGDAVAVALGAEYRKEKADYDPDDNLALGNNVIFGRIPPTAGEISVNDAFAEVRVPLAQDRPGLKLLEANAGYRYSDYNLAGSVDAYKYGLVWAPLESVRLRGSFQRAVRAPNIGELFSPLQPSRDTGVDPCFAGGASATLCQQTGVPAAAYGDPLWQCPQGQCTSLVGGYLALTPERSNTKSFGVVLRPPVNGELSLTLDYFDIDVRNAIAPLGASLQNVLDACYGTGAGQNPSQDPANPYCQQIVRDAQGRVHGGGTLTSPQGYILLRNANTAFLRTRGVDGQFSTQWAFEDLGMGWMPGTFALDIVGTYVDSYEQQLAPSAPSRECAGTFGLVCGQPNPQWRTNTRLTWSANDSLSLSARWRWIDAVTRDVDTFSGTIDDVPSHRIGSQSYLDLFGQWRLFGSIDLRAGITNVLDKEPPLLSLTVAGPSNRGLSNTFPATYDIGRQFFIGLTAKY